MEVDDPTDPTALADWRAIYSENQRDLDRLRTAADSSANSSAWLRDRLSLIRVGRGGRVIAGGAGNEFRGSMMLPWSGATAEVRPVYGTNALYWAGIRLASSPVATPSISGGRPSARCFEFKRQWGPTAVQPYWSTLTIRRGGIAAPSQDPADDRAVCGATCRWEWPARWTGLRRGLN